jgi:hypothetical protein
VFIDRLRNVAGTGLVRLVPLPDSLNRSKQHHESAISWRAVRLSIGSRLLKVSRPDVPFSSHI